MLSTENSCKAIYKQFLQALRDEHQRWREAGAMPGVTVIAFAQERRVAQVVQVALVAWVAQGA